MSNKSIFRLGQLLVCAGVAYNVHQAKGQELADRSYQIIEVQGKNVAAMIDERTGTINRLLHLRSANLSVGAGTAEIEDDVETVTKNFLAANPHLLRIPIDQVGRAHTMRSANWWSISFDQEYEGVPVLGSEIGLTLDEYGRLVSYGVRAYPDLQMDVAPTIDARSAIRLVRLAYPSVQLDSVALQPC